MNRRGLLTAIGLGSLMATAKAGGSPEVPEVARKEGEIWCVPDDEAKKRYYATGSYQPEYAFYRLMARVNGKDIEIKSPAFPGGYSFWSSSTPFATAVHRDGMDLST